MQVAVASTEVSALVYLFKSLSFIGPSFSESESSVALKNLPSVMIKSLTPLRGPEYKMDIESDQGILP